MEKKHFFLILTSFFYYSDVLMAQTTTISGKVLDAGSREPLPFVNILLKGTKSGTTSDFDGNYSISTTEVSDSLIISYIGYKQTVKPVRKFTSQVINIELHKSIVSLQSVEIKAGENPAHKILRKVIENKDNNNPEKLDAFQYEVYNKLELDINNLSEGFKKKKLFKPFEFIFHNIDSSDVTKKPYLPLFMSESITNYFYKRNPKYKKEIIKASKVSGIENNSVTQFTGDMYQKINIYDNAILIFGKNFISPISDHGLLFYKYSLIDSMMLDNSWCYQIQFKPRRKQELTFNGNIWVADTSFAIKRLEMTIADDANINFINNLHIIQEYRRTGRAWMLSKDKLMIDFALEDQKTGVYGRKTTSFKNIIINEPKEDKFYSIIENQIVEQDANKKSDEYWKAARHDSLSKNEQQIYKLVDTLKNMPVYKTYVGLISIFVSGYKKIGYFDIGPYYNVLSFNSIEGTRVRLGARTNSDFSKWYELSGHIAYGSKDENLKYDLGIRSFITKDTRQIIGLNYKNDVEVLGHSQKDFQLHKFLGDAFSEDNIFASIFRRVPLRNLTGIEQISGYYEREWFTGLTSRITFLTKRMSPLGDFRYECQTSANTIEIKNNIATSEIKFLTRFAYNEKYYVSKGEFNRKSLGSKYPILQFQYTMGLRGVFSSDYQYHKFNIRVSDRFRINPIGFTDYYMEYGKILGHLPYPLMEIHGGNETYTYNPYTFNMMNYYEFVSDEYATIAAFHHFDGFFLNKIPLFRKLKWREVVTAKTLIGKVESKNKNILLFPNTLNVLKKGPYYEAGVGVENILKVFRLDALWRLSYLENINIPKFGIRGSIQIIF